MSFRPHTASTSSHRAYASGSITNGTPSSSLQHAQKKLRRSHSVSPMRPSRNTYGKGNERHNVPVLRMVEQSIAAAAKLNKLLKPIDGPEAPRSHSRSAHGREDANNNHSHRLGTYNQPLRVDIPDQHSPNTPPTLPHAFSSERLLQPSNDMEKYLSGRMHQLSPPANACDRISPTMPVLVPHSIYSPVELPGASTDGISDPNLPILKNAKLDLLSPTASSVYNPLTLPFLSPVVDSRKVQSVPPIIAEPRRSEESRCARHSRHQQYHAERQMSSDSSGGTSGLPRYARGLKVAR